MEGIRVVGLPDDEGAPGAVAFDTGTDPRSQVRGPSGAAGQPQFNPTTRPHATAERSGGAADEQEGRRDRRGGGRQPGSDILVDLVTPIFLSLLGIAVLFMYNSGMIQFGSDSGDDSYASPFGLGFDGEEADGRQIRPQQLAVQIDLAQAFAGATVKLPVTRQEVCPVCSGNGADPAHGLRKCSRCGGRGHQVMHQQIGPFVQRVSVECPVCGGKGQSAVRTCSHCKGEGVLQATRELEVPIPKGARDGDIVTLRGQGDQVAGIRPGDVIVRVAVDTDSQFRREGDDLHVTLTLSLKEALLGAVRQVEHFAGHEVLVDRRGVVTSPDTVLRIAGQGMPRRAGGFGDLVVHFEVSYPPSLSEADASDLRRVFVQPAES